MIQCKLIATDRQLAYLQDEINLWLRKASEQNIKIINIFFPSGGVAAIFYTTPDEVTK